MTVYNPHIANQIITYIFDHCQKPAAQLFPPETASLRLFTASITLMMLAAVSKVSRFHSGLLFAWFTAADVPVVCFCCLDTGQCSEAL